MTIHAFRIIRYINVPHASITCESEVSITALCSAIFILLHSCTNQKLFKKYTFNQSSTIRWSCVPQCPSLSAIFISFFTAVQIKNCLKSNSAITVATMKYMDDFHCAKEEPSRETTKITQQR